MSALLCWVFGHPPFLRWGGPVATYTDDAGITEWEQRWSCPRCGALRARPVAADEMARE